MLLASASPAHAQVDFSGVWQPIYQEDVPERLAGPALRDYVGLPINDSATAVCRQLGSVPHHAA